MLVRSSWKALRDSNKGLMLLIKERTNREKWKFDENRTAIRNINSYQIEKRSSAVALSQIGIITYMNVPAGALIGAYETKIRGFFPLYANKRLGCKVALWFIAYEVKVNRKALRWRIARILFSSK